MSLFIQWSPTFSFTPNIIVFQQDFPYAFKYAGLDPPPKTVRTVELGTLVFSTTTKFL